MRVSNTIMIKENFWLLPVKTVSEANIYEHWTKKHKRHKLQKRYIWAWSKQNDIENTKVPCTIKLTRLGPKTLDYDDNLRMAFKWIKDYIADQILPGQAAGRADGDPRIKWEYDQEKSKTYAIKIEIS